MNTVHQNTHKNPPNESFPNRGVDNVEFSKRRILRGNNSMEHKRHQMKRDQTDHKAWSVDVSQGTHLPYIGYDNSDKNKLRNSIGSCTDTIAEERRLFGPWQIPSADREQKLVSRLAPHKLPPPPDPRFDSWVNHFQHYWDIGANVKPVRKSLQKSSNTGTSLREESSMAENQSAHGDGKFYMTSYHRLMGQRPRRLIRLQAKDCQQENQTGREDESGQLSETYCNKLGGKHRVNERRHTGQDYEKEVLLPGLDRRYLGLQPMNKQQVEDMVMRLTRMTSAYKAKFSPNPHVWVDTSPGAHMVIKRENTIG
ncbi:unnamed protein product [Candidula unifasciata]|uniref:Uncharacterized protein n=1 Tax=Candidula unifasciata TaxID=100452 RepID=A0A8S3YMW5_9EUPU|nr:unnamed protein product [Candidula unifasciata]